MWVCPDDFEVIPHRDLEYEDPPPNPHGPRRECASCGERYVVNLRPASLPAALFCSDKCEERDEEEMVMLWMVEAARGESEAEALWDWLGGYVERLEPVVETYLHGETPGERIGAFEKLDAYRRKRSDLPFAASVRLVDPNIVNSETDEDGVLRLTPDGLGGYGHFRGRSKAKRGRQKDTRPAVRVIDAGGESWESLGNDNDAIRAFVTAAAMQAGTTLDELVQPFARGRLSGAEQARRLRLAQVVAEARERGATQAALGAVIGWPKQRVSDLERAFANRTDKAA